MELGCELFNEPFIQGWVRVPLVPSEDVGRASVTSDTEQSGHEYCSSAPASFTFLGLIRLLGPLELVDHSILRVSELLGTWGLLCHVARLHA